MTFDNAFDVHMYSSIHHVSAETCNDKICAKILCKAIPIDLIRNEPTQQLHIYAENVSKRK